MKDMAQEEKSLLLKDLSARLSYGVVVELDEKFGFNKGTHTLVKELLDSYCVEGIKPYLRSMSSMTEEEFDKLKEYSELKYDQLELTSFQNGAYKCLDFYLNEVPSGAVIRVFDWLNKYHFDYRDLIQMGLAIAVTKENNPYKTLKA